MNMTMKKAILLLSAIVISMSCRTSSPYFDLSGVWSGTCTSSPNRTYSLEMSIIQKMGNFVGIWSSDLSQGGKASGTVSARHVSGSLYGPSGYSAYIDGTFGENTFNGTWTERGSAPFSFSLKKN